MTGPITKTYTRAEIEQLLGEVAPNDWHAFFQKRVYEVAPTPPTDELARSGWRLVYTSEPNKFIATREALFHVTDSWFGYGLMIGKDDIIADVREGSPAWEVGMAPGMKIVAIENQAYTDKVLKYASTQAQHSSGPTAFLVQQDGWYHTYQVNYHGGPQYPHLVRIHVEEDMLAKIMAPRASR